MKSIIVTQRVDINKEISERRDALDQRWILFLHECGFTPLLIPNNLKLSRTIIKSSKVSGILLTGGSDLSAYGGNSPERDETEFFLIDYAITKNIPVLGICRGMEVIQHYFGVKLEKVTGHNSKDHVISFNGLKRKVNSFHNLGSKKTVHDLKILAKAFDDVIESVAHVKYPIKGIMWHPERYNVFKKEDKNLFKEFFK